MEFDHIGIIAPSLAQGRDALMASLLIDAWTREFHDPLNHVSVQFGRDQSGVCYEIVSPLDNQSPISRALASGRQTLNHIAYLTDDLDSAASRLHVAKFYRAGPARPAIAFGGKRIQFFVAPLGFVLEIIEAPAHKHKYILSVPAGTTSGT